MKIILILIINFVTLFAFAKSGVQKAGDVFRYLSPVSAAIGSLYVEDYKGVGQLAISVLVTQGISELLKKAVPEKRPDWKPGRPKNSFPSGHVAATFSAASYLRVRYDNPYVYVPAYAVAVFTAYSRVKPKRHRVIDVVVGAALAEVVSYFAVNKREDVTLTPVAFVDNGKQIVGVNIRF